MTREKLLRFVNVRNASPFNSNLQFQIDADECGIRISELGTPKKLPKHDGYQWRTPFGILIEQGGRMRLESE